MSATLKMGGYIAQIVKNHYREFDKEVIEMADFCESCKHQDSSKCEDCYIWDYTLGATYMNYEGLPEFSVNDFVIVNYKGQDFKRAQVIAVTDNYVSVLVIDLNTVITSDKVFFNSCTKSGAIFELMDNKWVSVSDRGLTLHRENDKQVIQQHMAYCINMVGSLLDEYICEYADDTTIDQKLTIFNTIANDKKRLKEFLDGRID